MHMLLAPGAWLGSLFLGPGATECTAAFLLWGGVGEEVSFCFRLLSLDCGPY